jgi:hypothetical protein
VDPRSDQLGGGPCTHAASSDPLGVADRPIDAAGVPALSSATGALHRLEADCETRANGVRGASDAGELDPHPACAAAWAKPPIAADELEPAETCAAPYPPSTKPPTISAARHISANTTRETGSRHAPQDEDATATRPPTKADVRPCCESSALAASQWVGW